MQPGASILKALATLALASVAFAGDAPPPLQPTRSFAPPPRIDYRTPERSYVEHKAAGWTVMVERELEEKRPAVSADALKRLDVKLAEFAALIPEAARERLKKIPIFLLMGAEATGGGRVSGAEYFQKTAPDHYAYLDKRWGSSVVIYSAKNYLQQNNHWSVLLLVHEFAHAWHLEQWREKHPPIFQAWQNAVKEKLYENVKDLNGKTLEKAYAATNQLEYFAELSCAYFWRGEYEPFDREQLRKHDPKGFEMIEAVWGITKKHGHDEK
ncbi:MAG TPA: zinc-dependent peptidase [Planctomycetota bacterium]|nr:zinc-dependent peptidase [Planctomycetota bacterium]